MNTFKYIKPKLFSVLKNYSREQFTKDLIAGVIVAIIALPLSIALAIASGVKPEQGIYTAIVAGFFISFLGGSRVQIGGPTAAFVVIIYGIIAQYGMSGLTIATFLAGIMLILMGLLHFGNLIKFIPKTITVGFTLGIAIGIFSGQLKDLFGLNMGAVPAEFVEKMGKLYTTLQYDSVANFYDWDACFIYSRFFWSTCVSKNTRFTYCYYSDNSYCKFRSFISGHDW
jgi:Sulfate permease and related transporters (MFS superfamily)